MKRKIEFIAIDPTQKNVEQKKTEKRRVIENGSTLEEADTKMRSFIDVLLEAFEDAPIGLELTSKNSVFATILDKRLDLEIHIEYFLNENKYDKKILFNIFEGDNSIATGWDSLEKSMDRINKYVNKSSFRYTFGISKSSLTEAGV